VAGRAKRYPQRAADVPGAHDRDPHREFSSRSCDSIVADATRSVCATRSEGSPRD
jgi:hypothetical protein